LKQRVYEPNNIIFIIFSLVIGIYHFLNILSALLLYAIKINNKDSKQRRYNITGAVYNINPKHLIRYDYYIGHNIKPMLSEWSDAS